MLSALEQDLAGLLLNVICFGARLDWFVVYYWLIVGMWYTAMLWSKIRLVCCLVFVWQSPIYLLMTHCWYVVRWYTTMQPMLQSEIL